MKSILSTVKSRYIRGISERTARLDPDERRELAGDVEAALRSAPQEAGGVPPGSTPETSASTATTASTAKQASASESAAAAAVSGADGGYGHDFVDVTDAALADLDGAIALSRTKLEELERAERFVGVRCRRYKMSLERRAEELDEMEGAATAAATTSPGGAAEGGEEGPIRNEEEGLAAKDGDGTASQSAEQEMGSEPAEGGRPDVESGRAEAVPQSAEEFGRMREKQARDEEALSKVVETHAAMLANVERMRRTIDDLERKRGELLQGRNACREFLVAAEEAEEAEAMGEGMVAGRGGCPLTPGWGGPVGATEEGRHPDEREPVVDGNDLQTDASSH